MILTDVVDAIRKYYTRVGMLCSKFKKNPHIFNWLFKKKHTPLTAAKYCTNIALLGTLFVIYVLKQHFYEHLTSLRIQDYCIHWLTTSTALSMITFNCQVV